MEVHSKTVFVKLSRVSLWVIGEGELDRNMCVGGLFQMYYIPLMQIGLWAIPEVEYVSFIELETFFTISCQCSME